MESDQFFKIGHISRTHGNDGKVYIKLDVDDPSLYDKMESVFLDLENKPVPFFIETIRWTPNGHLVKFEDIEDRDDASRYVGTALLLRVEELPDLGVGKFYFHELVGCQLYDQDNNHIGEIALIYDQTSQVLLGVESNGSEILIPLVDEFKPDFQREQSILKMDLPEGLVDLN
jgi:16S rRNA processing protein RimM